MKLFKNFAIGKYTQTVGNKNEIDETVRVILIFQRFFGQHILCPRWTWKRFCLYQLATTFLFLYVMVGTYIILCDTDNIKIIVEACYTYLISIVCPIKYFMFVTKSNSVRKLYIDLKSTLYEIIKKDSPERLSQILDSGKKLVYCLLISMISPLLSYELRVIWFWLNGERVTLSRTTSILMPMSTPYFEIGLFLHSIYMFEAAFIIMQIDMWFVVFMFFFCVASDIAVKNLAVEKKRENEDEINYAIRLNNSLREYYKVHVKLVDFLNTLNGTFNWLTVVPQVGLAMSICLIMLFMSKGVDWSFVLNMLPVVGELFVYSWFGDQIKNKANDWKQVLLDFDWTSLRPKDRKSYYVMLSYLNKEFGVQPAVGEELTLVTMSKVFKFAYQVYTMLQTMD